MAKNTLPTLFTLNDFGAKFNIFGLPKKWKT